VNRLLHTPDGVRDIYGKECAVKNRVQASVMEQLRLFGYEQIETPTFEFFDIFSRDRGSVSSREMYKFFDRDNDTLVLRPDMTPAIARCVAKFFMDETMPVRLCYIGNTFINNSNFKGRLGESTQTGAELVGDDSVSADAETVILTIRCLQSAGLKDFQVEMGEVGFYKGLLADAGLTAEQDRTLRDLIENKNTFGVEEFADANVRKSSLREVFRRLPQLFGNIEDIRKAEKFAPNKESADAVERLKKVHAIIDAYGLADYVSYDLGMLSQYEYYTGIIFKAYSYGTGRYIVNGGRYDGLLAQYGKDIPAVGFGITVDSLLSALNGQHIDVPVPGTDVLIVFDRDRFKEASDLARKFRERKKSTLCFPRKGRCKDDTYREYAKKRGIGQVIFIGESKK